MAINTRTMAADARAKGWTVAGDPAAPARPPSEMDRVDERGRSKATGLPMGVEQAARFNAADPALQGERVPRGMMRSGSGFTFMPQGVESRARWEQAKGTMGPMPQPGRVPSSSLMPTGQPSTRGTMALPPAGTAGMPSLLERGTAGMPSLLGRGAGGMMRNANGDLTMAARDALDARTGYRRTDPMAMTGIAEASPMRRAGTMNLPGRATTNPNARPVGRSANDPDRIAEQMRRRGDPRFIMQRAAMREGQDFQREMFGAGQAAIDNRMQMQAEMGMMENQQRFQQGVQMFEMDTQRRANESEADFNRRMELERQQREAGRITGIGTMALPPMEPGGESPGYVPGFQTGDGGWKPVGGGPVMRPQEPRMGTMTLPDGTMIPTINGQPEPGLGQYQQQRLPGPVQPGQAAPSQTTRVDGGGRAEKPTISWQTDDLGNKVPYQTVTDPETGEVYLRKLRIVDANGDGIDDRTQGGGAAAAPSAPRTTADGNRFRAMF